MSPDAPTARSIAAAVRAGERSALEVLDEHLERVALRESDVHAFNHLIEAAARERAAALDRVVADGGDPGPLAGVPVALKDNLCTRGVPTTCSSLILDGWCPPYDATVVSRLADGGSGGGGQDQPGRVRHGVLHGELRLRPHPQPPRPEPGAGRVLGRVRRRRGRGVRPRRAGLGHRRLHPPARGPVRRGGGQAHLRNGVAAGPGGLRLVAGPDRPVRHHRGGRRRWCCEVIGGHDPGDSTSLPQPFPVRVGTTWTTVSTASGWASSPR